ncbi:unnamed protein product [Mytilus coruscus]|uniref:Uncharacterized protein n=1 Tax=Mytilus coruscus TaxID=42192 RepID=A0A6J8B0Y1_MYTCO|nr:unnamed protein product [Mytilus coruscus]
MDVSTQQQSIEQEPNQDSTPQSARVFPSYTGTDNDSTNLPPIVKSITGITPSKTTTSQLAQAFPKCTGSTNYITDIHTITKAVSEITPQTEEECNKQVSNQSARVDPSYTDMTTSTEQQNEQLVQITHTSNFIPNEQQKVTAKQAKATKNTGLNQRQQSKAMDSPQRSYIIDLERKLKDRDRTIEIMEKRLSQLERREQTSSMNNQEQNYTNTCHANNGCNSNNNSCQIQQIMNNVKMLEFQLTQHMCMNTALTTQMAMQLQQSILLKQATCPPTMPLPAQYQPYNHGMYTVNPSTGIYIPTSFHIPPPMPTYRPHQFMNQQMGQPTPTVLQQPPPFHHQIHVPSFIQPPNQRSQYQNNNHLSGPGIPPPTYLQSGFNINPPNIHSDQAQNKESTVPPQYSMDSSQPEKDNHEEQTRANINMPQENDLDTHKKESTEANNGARPKKIKKTPQQRDKGKKATKRTKFKRDHQAHRRTISRPKIANQIIIF